MNRQSHSLSLFFVCALAHFCFAPCALAQFTFPPSVTVAPIAGPGVQYTFNLNDTAAVVSTGVPTLNYDFNLNSTVFNNTAGMNFSPLPGGQATFHDGVFNDNGPIQLGGANLTVDNAFLFVGGGIHQSGPSIQVTNSGLLVAPFVFPAGPTVNLDLQNGVANPGFPPPNLTLIGYGVAVDGLTILAPAVVPAGTVSLTQPIGLPGSSAYVISTGAANLGPNFSMSGGTLTAPNGITVPSGSMISGSGTYAANVAVAAGGQIAPATGTTMTLGNAASSSGFFSAGLLSLGTSTLVLLDSNKVDLQGSTTMGSGLSDGFLTAANGALHASGASLTGYGIVTTTNSLATAFTNNGSVAGSSTLFSIWMQGYVNGTGTFDNTEFFGTLDPGLSATALSVGSIRLHNSNTLKMELGGLTEGTQFDSISASGQLTLAGTLDVVLIDGFNPAGGNMFDLFDGTMSGTFATINLPALSGGLTWDTTQLYTTGTLIVLPEPSTLALAICGLMGTAMMKRRRARKNSAILK